MTTPTTVQVRLQIRADTAANWASVNPVLLANELGLESDTKKFKVGNGSSAWNSLAYFPSIVSGGTVLGNLEIGTTGTLTFEGSTANAFETTLGVVDPTADRTILLPNQSGTVVVGGNASITDADIAANAEISVSKLADGAARQLLQTDAAGTGVEWTDNVDVPGTLDVTGAATFDSSVTIQGDLTVNGTTTTIDTQNLIVEDKNVIIGNVTSPTDVTADGGGITLKGTTDKTIQWIDSTDAWTLSEHVNIASGKEYRIAGTKVLDATSLGSGVVSSSLTSVGTIATGTWQGSAIASGYGGTGQTTYTDGQLLIGKTDGTLAKATLTASTGVTITNGDGTITISSVGLGGTVTGVTATSPLASTGGTAPVISIQDGTTAQKGAVQLEDSTSSTSTTKAATPNSVKSAYDLAAAALPVAGGTVTGNLEIGTTGSLTFEGSTADGFETTLGVTDPTADRTITLPDVSGTVVTTGDTGSVTSTMIADGTILNADVNASAAIAGTKISPDFGSQNVTTTGTVTGASLNPTSSTVPTNGVYLPAANSVGISTNGTQRVTVDTAATTSTLPVVHPLGAVGTPSITFTGDLNTGIWSPAADTIAASTGGSERLRIDSSGRVGIGTTSPAAPLHVAGTVRVGAADTSDANLQIGNGLSGNRASYLDLTGDTTYSSYGLRVLRNNSGANASSQILHRGTGNLDILTQEVAPIIFGINNSERVRIDSSGRLLVGTSNSTDNARFDSKVSVVGTGNGLFPGLIVNGYTGTTNASAAPFIDLGRSRGTTDGSYTEVANNDTLGYIVFRGTDGAGWSDGAFISCQADGDWTTSGDTTDSPGRLVFSTTADGASSPTERMRITQNGGVYCNGKTTDAIGTVGVGFSGSSPGNGTFTGSGIALLTVNRKASDGTLVEFYQDEGLEGTISVSGTTVSYNGAHLSRWSQLPSGTERTEILRGSVLSNLDEMCEWGEEDNEQLNRMKVSDVEGDKNVSGVFQAWDDDDDTYTNDFYCAMTGDFIIRIAQGVTVQRGDLLMSAGDGTAKPQDDDIIRSKTIAKVTSTNVSCTYEDGSYCVPCVLMAC